MMDAKKRKTIVYILFGLALIYGFYNLESGFDKKAAKLAHAPAPASEPAAPVLIPAKTINIEQYSTLSWGRDPFYRAKRNAPAAAAKKKQIEWILGGIMYDANSPTAVVNKKIVAVGDKINGAIIIDISKTKVVLKKGNSDIVTLKIKKEKS